MYSPGIFVMASCRYGINRQESQYAMMNDEELCFKELKEKFPEAAAAMPVPSATTTTPGAPGLVTGPFQRRPGLKKPGPKKGVPRKKKPQVVTPPTEGGASEATPTAQDEGKEIAVNGEMVDGMNHERTGEDSEHLDGDADRTKEEEGEERMDDGENGSQGGGLDSSELEPKLEPRPDSADMMSQDDNSINDDLDEGLGSGNDDDDDDDELGIGDDGDDHHSPVQEEKMDLGDESADSTSKISGIDTDAIKTENMDDEYDMVDGEIKGVDERTMKLENLSDDNSTHDGGTPEEEKPSMSVLQHVLMKGADENHIPEVKQEGAGGAGTKPTKSSSTKKKDSTPKVVVPSFRWPKVRDENFVYM